MRQVLPNYAQSMQSFFNTSLDAISIVSIDGTIQYVNPAFEALYGYPSSMVLGKSMLSVFPESSDDLSWMIHRIDAGEEVRTYETRRRKADGDWVDMSITISPIEDSSGSTHAYLKVGRDITEKRKVEAALRHIEALFRLIEENITDTVVVLRASGEVEYASKSHEALLGVAFTDIAGTVPLHLIHPDDVGKVRQAFANLRTTKTPRQALFRMSGSDREWLDMEVILTPALDDKNEITRIICVGRDVTYRRRTEQLMMRTEKLAVVSQLGAALAHEIRNPLTSIKGFLQLMQSSQQNNDRYFDITFSELEHLEAIIDDFLTSVKPTESSYLICHATKILQQSISLMQPEAHMNNVAIELCSSPDEFLIRGDANKLQQVFVNVLKNAIESMQNGGTIQVEILTTDQNIVTIHFRDEGEGIPQHLLSKLGSPFYTTKEKGTGLGLTVCANILHEHHGDIRFESSLGQGTSVFIDIPLYTEE